MIRHFRTKLKIMFSLIFFLMLLGPVNNLLAACGTPCSKSGTIWTCTDISRECVQDAVNSSEASWTPTNELRLVAGETTWADPGGTNYCSNVVDYTAALCLHRGIKLTGGYGGGVTKITLTGPNVTGGILYSPNSTARDSNEPFEFSRFTLDLNGVLTNGSKFLAIGNSGPTALYPHGRIMSGMKIHDNIFQNGGYETIGISGAVTGVAYNNRFINVMTPIRGEGADSSWIMLNGTPIPYGSGDAFYFEDNIIESSVSREFGGWTAGQGFPGIVTRYNTIDMKNSTAQQILDLHGLQSMTSASDGTCNGSCISEGACYTTSCCQQWSQMKAEIYGNIWTNYEVSNPLEWMRHRGGWMMMFNNSITGPSTAGMIDYYQYSCDSCQDYPASPIYSQHVQNTYVWNNVANGNARPYVKLADLCADNVAGSPYTITANTDYWNYNANTLNGSTQKGINCGSVAPASNCSIGDGYWQASYAPCSAPPTTMADMKTYTQAAKFYKCTAPNTWTLYYQPYTYPHPLRLTDSTDTTPPAPPTGLAVQ